VTRYDQYQELSAQGKHKEAGEVLGALIADVGGALIAAGAAGKTVLKGTTKLAGLYKGVIGRATAVEVVAKVVVENMPTQLNRITTSGARLVTTPNQTTTILGRFVDDMKDVISELQYPKTLDFEAKPGGFNVLNTPDELYVSPQQFWIEYNKPFLEKVIERGDDIVLATKPTAKSLFKNGVSGETTAFGKEYKLLKDSGYVYDPSTSRMIKE
jgi:hypothetical protein